jgi:hypothetical protein
MYWKTRIIRSSELEKGYMNEWQRAFMKHFNENPTFDNEDKPYTFIKAVKTNTDVHGWIFEAFDKIYVATQKLMWRGPETVHIYESSVKGNFSIGSHIATIERICDIETAVDEWFDGVKNTK